MFSLCHTIQCDVIIVNRQTDFQPSWFESRQLPASLVAIFCIAWINRFVVSRWFIQGTFFDQPTSIYHDNIIYIMWMWTNEASAHRHHHHYRHHQMSSSNSSTDVDLFSIYILFWVTHYTYLLFLYSCVVVVVFSTALLFTATYAIYQRCHYLNARRSEDTKQMNTLQNVHQSELFTYKCRKRFLLLLLVWLVFTGDRSRSQDF